MNVRLTLTDEAGKQTVVTVEGFKKTAITEDIQAGFKSISDLSKLTPVSLERGGEYEDIGLGD